MARSERETCAELHNEVSRAWDLPDPGEKVGALEKVSRRALRAGCEAAALTAQQMLLGYYEDKRRFKRAHGTVKRLTPLVMPEIWARAELKGISDGGAAVLEASEKASARERIAALGALRLEAIRSGALATAVIVDMFLFGSFARIRKRHKLKRLLTEIELLERHPQVVGKFKRPVATRLRSCIDRRIVGPMPNPLAPTPRSR